MRLLRLLLIPAILCVSVISYPNNHQTEFSTPYSSYAQSDPLTSYLSFPQKSHLHFTLSREYDAEGNYIRPPFANEGAKPGRQQRVMMNDYPGNPFNSKPPIGDALLPLTLFMLLWLLIKRR